MSQLHLKVCEGLLPFSISCSIPLKAKVCFKKTKIKHCSELCLHPCENTFLFLLCEVLKSNIYFIVFGKKTGYNAAWGKKMVP